MSQVIHWTDRTSLHQDPTAEIVRHFSWERWLVPGAQLQDSDWAITGPDTALVIDNDSITNNGLYSTFRLKGGTLGATYAISNSIETDETPAQKDKKSITVVIGNE